MNGCQFEYPSFTLPAGSPFIDQHKWDLAFLTEAEFIEKHGEEAYKEVRGTNNQASVSGV